MGWCIRLSWLLLAASALVVPVAGRAQVDASHVMQPAIIGAADAFVRAAPVPEWAELASAPAVPPEASHRPVVVRLAEVHLHAGPPPTRLSHRVVQVNDASALGDIGQLLLEFNPQFERLVLHKVLILRGGETIDHTRTVPVRFLQRETQLEKGIFSGVVTASFVLPGVRVGDTLRLVHSIVGENPALNARYVQQVAWEQPYPILLSRITLTAPAERQIRWRWFGGAGDDGPLPVEHIVDGIRRLRFEAQHLGAASAEPLMPPNLQPMRRLQFSEYADWNEVARWAVALFPPDASLPDEMITLMARLRALPDPEEQASQALQWVQSEIRPWSVTEGECALRPQPPAVVVRRAYGDCKDKALLLSSMLHGLGIDARPTLAAMLKRADPASMLPAPDNFDHVIVQVRLAGRDYYVDPTRSGQTGLLSRMGQRFEGASVLPVDPGTQDLVTVRSPNRDEIFRSRMSERMSLASFDAEGRLDVDIEWFGLNAEDLRQSLKRMDAAGVRQLISTSYARQYAGSRLLGEPRVSDDRRLNQLTISASFAIPRLAQAAGGDVWAVAFAPALGDAIPIPPKLVRRFPLAVPSFPVAYHYEVDMNWPDGVSAASPPASHEMETPHFRLSTMQTVSGNTERRSVDFVARVGEVPAAEVSILVDDLGRLAQRIGGVMLAVGSDSPTPAPSAMRQPDPRPVRSQAITERGHQAGSSPRTLVRR